MKYNQKNLRNILIIFFIIGLTTYFIFSYSNDLINFFLEQDNYNYLYFLCLISFNLVYLLTPLPVTPVIILNGFLLSYLGFFISYSILIIDSAILFLIFRNSSYYFYSISKFIFSKIYPKYENVFINSKKTEFIFISRFLLPPYLHNVYYSLIKTKFKPLIFAIGLSEIPTVIAWTLCGYSLKSYIIDDLDLYEVILNIHFILALIIVCIILLFTKKYKL